MSTEISTAMVLEVGIVALIMFNLLILMQISRSRFVPGQPGRLPVLSTLSRWIYGTENPIMLLFFFVMMCVIALVFLQGCHLTLVGPIPFVIPAC